MLSVLCCDVLLVCHVYVFLLNRESGRVCKLHTISEAVVNSVELVCVILLVARLHRHNDVVVCCLVSFCVVDLLVVFAGVFVCLFVLQFVV